MTINATAMWLLALYQVIAEEQGAPSASWPARRRTTSSRSTSRAGPTCSRPARRLRLITDMVAYTVARCRAGTRSTSAATTCRRQARRRCRRSRMRCRRRSPSSTRCATRARSTPADFGEVVGRISFFVNAGVRFVEEMCKMRAFAQLGRADLDALRGDRPEAAPLPLRRAGQLAGPDRGPAGEQRPADRPGDARRDAVARRAGPRGAAAGVERGARAAAAVGPAVVAAAPAGPGLRVRPPRVRGPLHRVGGGRGESGRAGRGRPGGDGPGGRSRWRGRRGRDRLHEVRSGRLARRRVGAGSSRAARSSSVSTGSPPPNRARSRPTWARRSRPSTPTWRRLRWRPCAAGGRSATRTRPGAYGRSGPSSGCGPRLRARPTSCPRPWSAPAPG